MTDLFETIRRVLVPIHKEGYPFIAIGIVLTVLAGTFVQFLGWIFLLLTCGSATSSATPSGSSRSATGW